MITIYISKKHTRIFSFYANVFSKFLKTKNQNSKKFKIFKIFKISKFSQWEENLLEVSPFYTT